MPRQTLPAKKHHLRLVFAVTLLMLSTKGYAHENLLDITYGYNYWNDTRFTINGANIELDNKYRSIGVNYAFLFNKGFALSIGGEYGRIDLLSDSSAVAYVTDIGYGNIYKIPAEYRYYFSTGRVRSYIGAGLGYISISIHSNLYNTNANATLSGATLSGVLGVEAVIHRRVGVTLEYKYNNISMSDSALNRIDTTSNEIILGLKIRIGH